MSDIIKSFTDVTGIVYQGGPAQDFYRSVVQAVAALSDDDWNELSEEAKAWYNECANAYDADGENAVFPPMEGFTETEAVVEEEVAEEAEKKTKAPKPPKEKKPKAPKEKKVRESSPSNSGTMRELLMDNIDISLDDLLKALEEKGMVAKRSSAHIVWFNSQQVMKVMLAKGEFKNGKGEVFKIVKQ